VGSGARSFFAVAPALKASAPQRPLGSARHAGEQPGRPAAGIARQVAV